MLSGVALAAIIVGVTVWFASADFVAGMVAGAIILIMLLMLIVLILILILGL